VTACDAAINENDLTITEKEGANSSVDPTTENNDSVNCRSCSLMFDIMTILLRTTM
jgi:Pyruvate/2-oxoacid:ferredoxin oxidoreductase delta subunit